VELRGSGGTTGGLNVGGAVGTFGAHRVGYPTGGNLGGICGFNSHLGSKGIGTKEQGVSPPRGAEAPL